VQLPEQYTDMHTGEATGSGDIDPEQWKNLVSGTNELGRVMLKEFGVNLVFHPHVDTHVDTQDRIERFLTDTDPQFVNLCLDIGHIAYCDGDNVDIVRKFPDRITYVHLKRVTPRSVNVSAPKKFPSPMRSSSASWSNLPTESRLCHLCSTPLVLLMPTSTRSSSKTSIPSNQTTLSLASARSAGGRTDRT
jgi:hypothetical protein